MQGQANQELVISLSESLNQAYKCVNLLWGKLVNVHSFDPFTFIYMFDIAMGSEETDLFDYLEIIQLD
jgi:hypothetical protein